MVVLAPYMYLFKQLFDLVLLVTMIFLVTNLRSRHFYFILGLMLFPAAFISLADSLFSVLMIMLLIVILRLNTWKKNLSERIDEIIGMMIALTLYWIVPLFPSIVVMKLFHLQLGSESNQQLLPVIIMILLDWVLGIMVVLFLKKIFFSRFFSMDEKKIYTVQLGVFMLFVFVTVEILRRMQALGVFRIIMIGFLLVQFAFTLYFTYSSLKKNHEKNEVNRLKEQITMVNIYTSEIERNYQEMRKFKHDYKNLLIGLKVADKGANINQGYLNEMMEYSHQMVDSSIMRFSGISNIGIDSLKSLMVTKLLKAEQAGLNQKFECLKPVEDINLSEVDLIRIVGILLDNAVEAAIESNEKQLMILLICHCESIEITIENSYPVDLPTFKMMKKEGFSSKGKGRGLGLSNGQKILATNPQAEMSSYVENGRFVTTLIMRNE